MTNKINVTDLQFTGKDETNQKLRRLVQDLVAAERAVNSLILAVSDLSNASAPQVTIDGITYTGLVPGQVLTALTATSAAFKTLNLEGLADVAVESPTDLDVLTYFHGQWVNSPLPEVTPPPAGVNIGTGADIYAGISGGNLAFKSIQGDGATINVAFTDDTLTLSFIGGAITGPQGMQGPPGMDGDPGEDGLMGPPGMAGTGGGLGGGLTYPQVSAIASMRM